MSVEELNRLLAIVDKTERKEALLKFARSVGIKTSTVYNHEGEFIEEKLVLALFDDFQSYRKVKRTDIHAIVIGVALLVVMCVVIVSVMPKVFKESTPAPQEKERKVPPVYQVFDEDGNPIVDDSGAPVLSGLTDGLYVEYYDNGVVKNEYTYENGVVVRKKLYDETGKLTADTTY